MPARTKIAKDILEEINSYRERKSLLDSSVNLSQENSKKESLVVDKVDSSRGFMTLLSEGSILYQDGSIRLYIAKGALQRWFDSIDDSFEGYVTTAHVDLNSYPVREGYFRKEHLKLVTDEDGRSDLLVKPVINTELSNIRDIIIQNEPFAISSEFVYTDKEITQQDIPELAKLVEYNESVGCGDQDIPIAGDVNILGFSFVGNPGNAKSGGYEPSILLRNEEERLEKENILDRLIEKLNTKEELAKPEEVATDPEVVKEEPVEEAKEEKVVEEVKEEAPKKEAELSTDLLDTATQRIEELEAENAKLKEELESLTQFKQEKEAEQATVEEKLAKLEKLLTKSSVAKVEEKKEEKLETKSIFGRERFGGIK